MHRVIKMLIVFSPNSESYYERTASKPPLTCECRSVSQQRAAELHRGKAGDVRYNREALSKLITRTLP